jgi:DNA-binding response OmpR family regulator
MASESVPPAADPPGVLIVDDEVPLCVMVSEILGALGYRVWQANSASQALEQWKRLGPRVGLVLLDVVMPGMDGLTLLGTLRRERPNTAIALISGRLDADTRWLATESGCHYLPKPFEIAALVQLTKDLLGPPPLPPADSL